MQKLERKTLKEKYPLVLINRHRSLQTENYDYMRGKTQINVKERTNNFVKIYTLLRTQKWKILQMYVLNLQKNFLVYKIYCMYIVILNIRICWK